MGAACSMAESGQRKSWRDAAGGLLARGLMLIWVEKCSLGDGLDCWEMVSKDSEPYKIWMESLYFSANWRILSTLRKESKVLVFFNRRKAVSNARSKSDSSVISSESLFRFFGRDYLVQFFVLFLLTFL